MTLYLVRHASAGSRGKWSGDDTLRPLDEKGLHEADQLGEALGDRPIGRLFTSPYLRCRQTLMPLGERLDLTIADHVALREGEDPEALVDQLRELASDGIDAVLCSHGDIVPPTIRLLKRRGMAVMGEQGSRKGSTWVLETKSDEIVSGTYARKPTDLGGG